MLLVLVVSFILNVVGAVEVVEGGAMVVVEDVGVEVVEVVEVEGLVVVVLYCCICSMLMTPWLTQL